MKKIILLLIISIALVSCQQESTLEEINQLEQLNLEFSLNLDQSRAASVSLPSPLCNASTSYDTTGFYFMYSDTDAWGNYIRIRPQDANGDRGIGKMYVIDSSNGIAFVAISHGINVNGGYIFSVEEMQTPAGNEVAFCGLNYSF